MNKKALIILSVIGVVAAFAIGGTVAYFNDTETSTGNIFVAGSIDLKVDHKYASYNDDPCIDECVEDTNTNLILNGSFEVPEVTNPANWEIFPNGYPGLIWTVEWESVQTTYGGYNRPAPALTEYHENVLGPAQDGDQYTELDSDWFGPGHSLNGEPALTKIYQNIATEIGTQYTLHYWYSPRPNIVAANNILKVRIDDNEIANHSANGGSTTSWTEYTYTFTASAVTTKVEFAGGGTADSLGAFLDNVKLHPHVCSYQFVGGTCTLWDEKDLTENEKFFNFNDVKPGHKGINVISVHVYENDSWLCLMIDNKIDNENNLVEPEIEYGDTSDGPGEGELSENITLFVWRDNNGDGVYQPGTETEIDRGSFSELNNMPVYDSNTEGPLPACETKYVGIAWCAGTININENTGDIFCDPAGMGNDCQSDSLSTDIIFYAEQYRNNPDFVCGG